MAIGQGLQRTVLAGCHTAASQELADAAGNEAAFLFKGRTAVIVFVVLCRRHDIDLNRTTNPAVIIGSLPAGSAESVNRTYVTGTLSFYLRLIETALESLLEVPTDEAIEFDLDALLRADFAQRMDAYAKGVQGGILTPDEARAKEWLAATPGGDKAFIQRQCVPLDLSIELAQAEIASKQAPPPPPPQQEEIDSEDLRAALARWAA